MSPAAQLTNLLASIRLFTERIAAVSDDGWASDSPCEGWSARDVADHVIGNLRGLGSGIAGGDFITGQGEAGPDVHTALAEAAADLEEAAHGELPDTMSVGGNAVPTLLMFDNVMRDIVIHTWDVARAVGVDETLPDDLVAEATAAMATVTDQLRRPGLYGAIVEAAPDASAQDRLIALSGRRV